MYSIKSSYKNIRSPLNNGYVTVEYFYKLLHVKQHGGVVVQLVPLQIILKNTKRKTVKLQQKLQGTQIKTVQNQEVCSFCTPLFDLTHSLLKINHEHQENIC